MNNLSKNNNQMYIKVPTFENTPKVFKGVRFDVHTVQLPGKGKGTIQRDVVVHPGAVIIFPLLDVKHVIMIRNHRFAVGKELWELPAGTLEPEEPPIETAKRELVEETGYRSENIEPLLSFYTTPGFCNEVMYAFIAYDLEHVGQKLEDTEQITVEVVSLKNTLEMIRDGTINDGKTIATLLFYHQFKTI